MIHNLFVNHPPSQRRRDAKRRVLFYHNAHGGKVGLRFVFVSVEILVPMILCLFFTFSVSTVSMNNNNSSLAGWLKSKVR